MKASVTEHLGEGPAVITIEAVAGSIKAEQRRPRERVDRARQREETERDRGKKPSKTERKKIHSQKQNRENASIEG